MKIKQFLRNRAVGCSVAGVLLLQIIASFSDNIQSSGQASESAGHQINTTKVATQQEGEKLEPSPKLSPGEVINIQLKALQRNDTPTKDSGIATAFKFASPANKEATGPLDKFVQLVKSAAYRPMLNHRSAALKTLQQSDELAHLKATLVDAQGTTVVYVFILSKQHDAPYQDCWMTDAVLRVPEKQEETGQPIAWSMSKRRQSKDV